MQNNPKIRINEFFFDNSWKHLANYQSGTNYCEIDYNNRDKIHFNSSPTPFDDLPSEFGEILTSADNRMHQGKFRYGPIKRQKLDTYDTAKECIRRIERYIEGGRENLELIVDAFNMCSTEFYKGKKLGKTVVSIDDGEHAKEI